MWFFFYTYPKSMPLTGQYGILVTESFLMLSNQCLQCCRVYLIISLIAVMAIFEDPTPTTWPFWKLTITCLYMTLLFFGSQLNNQLIFLAAGPKLSGPCSGTL